MALVAEHHFRMTKQESRILAENARKLGVSKSSLSRSLISIPIEVLEVETAKDTEEKTLSLSSSKKYLVYDKKTFPNLLMQLKRWGYHYNQAVHAMNTIASKKFMRPEETESIMLGVITSLNEIEEMRTDFYEQITTIASEPKVMLGR